MGLLLEKMIAKPEAKQVLAVVSFEVIHCPLRRPSGLLPSAAPVCSLTLHCRIRLRVLARVGPAACTPDRTVLLRS
jgi:hypothetical protein